MCWAMPALVIEINKDMATVKLGDLTQNASIALMDNVAVGDYLLVHAGFAIQKLDKEIAEYNLRIISEISG